ncbi:MAG: hypothetical protein ABSB74_20330 [Tepidisphaeraceae bacterium]
MVDVQKQIESRIEEIRKEYSELSFALKVCQRFTHAEVDRQKGPAQSNEDLSSSKPFLKDVADRNIDPEAATKAA